MERRMWPAALMARRRRRCGLDVFVPWFWKKCMDASVPWWGNEAGCPSAAGHNAGVLTQITSWKRGSRPRKWLLISGAMDPPKDTAYEPKVRENGERSGEFLDGINLDFLHMEKVVRPDLFNKVMDMQITVADAKKKIKHFFKACQEKDCVPMLYYTGHGQRGSGNWCFADGVLSFPDIFNLLPNSTHYPCIFTDCCFSGHWANLARVSHDGKIRVVAATPYFMTAPDSKDTGGDFTFYITGHQDAKSLKRPVIYSEYSLADYPLPTSVNSYPYGDRVAGEASFGQRFVIAQHFYDGKCALVLGRLPDYDWGTRRWAACTHDSWESHKVWVKEQWDKGLRVMHCSCDGERFGAYAVQGWGGRQSFWAAAYDQLKEWIHAKLKEGLTVTSVCPGIKDDWVVFMTECEGDHLYGNSTGAQWFGLMSTWKDVRESISKQQKKGKIVTALAAKEGAWFLVMTESNRAQEYVWGPADGTFPDVKDPEVLDQSMDITTILRDPEDGRWLAIGTGGLNAQSCACVSDVSTSDLPV